MDLMILMGPFQLGTFYDSRALMALNYLVLLSVFANYGALCKLTKARSLGPLSKVGFLIRV